MTQESCPIFRCTSRDGRFVFDIMPGQSVRVGRSKEHSDFVIDSNMLSRLHAIFRSRDGECVLEYGPNTGPCILVNGAEISKEGVILKVGDSIKFNSNVILELGRLDEAGNLERTTRTQRPIRWCDGKTNATLGAFMLLLLVFVVGIVLWVVMVVGLRLTIES